MKKTHKINIKKAIIIYSILIIPILIISFIMIMLQKKDFMFEVENIMVNKENYNMLITYPLLNDNKFNKKINKMIKSEKKEFLSIVKNDMELDNHPFDYELNINYSYTTFDNIYSIHFKKLRYTGGAHYDRDDIVFYYDKKSDKEVNLEDLIIDKEKFYKILKDESKKYLLSNKEKLSLYSEDNMITEGINNLKYLSFSEDSLWIIFPPYEVGPWSSGEILVPINYNSIKDNLNQDYFDVSLLKNNENNSNNNQNNNQEKPNNNNNKGEINNDSSNVQAIIRDSAYFKDKKLIALTFDDGPSWKITENFLDELNKRNAKVSFFMLGNRAKSQGKLVKRIYEEGHTIGSHTYDHKNLKNLKIDEVMYEVNETNKILKNFTGVEPKYLRPPYGNYNNEILEATNMSFILWNVDTEDWKKKDSEKVAQYIIDNAKDGDIILLHDLYKTSIEGALKAIDELKDKGYAFVSLDELIKFKGKNAENHKAYRYFK